MIYYCWEQNVIYNKFLLLKYISAYKNEREITASADAKFIGNHGNRSGTQHLHFTSY